MKNNYVKSIGLVLLGVILSTIIFYFLPKESSSKNYKEYQLDKHLVSIDSAKKEIAAYQMWLKFLPKNVKFDYANKKITFPDTIDILKEDFNVLKTYCFRFLKANHYGETKDMTDKEIIDSLMKNPVEMPFHAKVNYSYYISRYDIDKAFVSDENATGINVYLAMRGLASMKLDDLQSHLYVVPTQKIENPIIKDSFILKDSFIIEDSQIISDGIKYVLDLTDPCPALCDKDSITGLYHPKLKPLK